MTIPIPPAPPPPIWRRWPPKRGPTLTPQTSGTTSRLIGVDAVNQNVAWVSGADGTFAVTTDGGATWRAGVVPGAEALEFRDVEGVSATEAYLLSIGSGSDSRIYHTTDGGETWDLQFQNADPDAFYDCFAFWTPNRGFAFSDRCGRPLPRDSHDRRRDVGGYR